MEKIKLILVDDHLLVRTAIASLLSGESGFEVIGEASGSVEFFGLLQTLQPDVVMLDISLKRLSGIEIAKHLQKDYPNIRILMVSLHTSEEYVLESINAGARGYLPKDTTQKELFDCIYALNAGEEYFAKSVLNLVLSKYIKKSKSFPAKAEFLPNLLTKRENEILNLFAKGESNQEIANELFISIRTVESHKNHIMAKLGLKSYFELVKYSVMNNIA